MDAVEEIKRRLDLVDYVSRTVPLQRSGRNFKACCPFHSERTPSFYVFPDRGSWRCFGQSADGGDIFSFVEKRDNGTFKDALELLAREAGVELVRRSQDDRDAEERLRAVVDASAAFFQEQLAAPAGAEARAYLERRVITPETIAAFRIGWAPDEWRRLHDHLGAQGFAKEDMLRAGLVIERDDASSVYDRFRGRVIIPIADERGQLVGFGGRTLGDGQPKYLNSPQTKLFDKGRTLFGLNTARDAIRAEGAAVVVEGYMDVIGPWQAGFRNVVATMGTSLTEQHARMLTRFSKRIVLAMDPDAAGRQAAERAGEIVLSAGSVPEMMLSARSASNLSQDAEVDLRVAPLPAGRDPDEIIRDDPDLWRRAIAEAQPYVEFLLE
ncbi:MAG TPA: DNA primase, partial [Acidimicrobiia bacterium]|nr:DNA primase [Acidimicrobiia bacterium]